MFFGTTTFSQAPFSDIGIADANVAVTGSRVNVSIGNITVVGKALVLPNGNRYNLTTGTVTVKEGANVPVTGNQYNLGTGTVTLKVGTSSGGTQVLSQEFTVSNAGEGEIHTTTFNATASTLYITLASASATSNIDYITINENIQPQRLTYITYEDFQRNYRENDLANNPESYGIPKFVYSTQDGKFGLSPIPDRGNYTIAFEYWKTHSDLSASTDTPDLTTRYHGVIVSRAKYYAYILRGNQVMADICNQEYLQGLARMRVELINRDEQMRYV